MENNILQKSKKTTQIHDTDWYQYLANQSLYAQVEEQTEGRTLQKRHYKHIAIDTVATDQLT